MNAQLVKDVVYLLAFLASAVAFSFAGESALAGGSFGAAAAYAIPEGARARIPVPPAPLAAIAGIVVAGLVMSGCGAHGPTMMAVARVTCGGVAKLHEACSAAGLSPDDPCPVIAGEP